MRVLINLCFVFLLIFVDNVSAMPVSLVHRGDSRKPSDVFTNGFHAWGVNINYNAHILGVSGRRGTRDSAFIPTTSSLRAANNFARDLLNVSPDQRSYVYHIRPTENFYSALDTINFLYDREGVRVPESIRYAVANEQEYSAYQTIPPQLIQSVTIYSRTSDGVIIIQEETNPNYQDGTSHSSDTPFNYGLYPITSGPVYVMGESMTNINNEMPNNSSVLPSPSYIMRMLSCCVVVQSEL